MNSDDKCKARLARRLKRRSIANSNFRKKSGKNSFKMEDVHIDLDEHDEGADDNARRSNDCHDDGKTEKNNEQVGDPQPNMCLDDDVMDCDYKIFFENLRVGGNFVFRRASGIPVRYEADAESSSNPEIIAVGKNPFCGGDRSPFISSKCDSIIDLDSKKSNGSPGSSSHSQYQGKFLMTLCFGCVHFSNGKIDLDSKKSNGSPGSSSHSQYQAPKNCNASNFFSHNPLGGHLSLKSYPEEQLLKPSWSSSDFAIGQVWALYSGKHFLPRQYIRIDNLISESQVCGTFLEALPTFDHEIAWKKEKLPTVSGMFEVSGISVNLEMSQFSHLVNSQKSNGQPLYKIYPLKGEVWALYKNWNSKWKRSDYENYQCHVVQILSDLCEGDVIRVARLKEVKGCLAFFHRQRVDQFYLSQEVSTKEMLSFSHQIPAFQVPRIRKYGIRESSWYLEPNALPPKRRN
ncbi:uncharacterized protein LOC132181334 isoform X2 [Corylus avellana]|uniref:uncharacterized protein LOC132181334 isoform X2 n=1 Tax=Corylus avellana TaxID=13451 RepID=UPI00286C8183|nr:uncharacterized protein LOC132181334 isoform X2 [Corylus avellana]